MSQPRDADNEPTDVRGEGGRVPPGLDDERAPAARHGRNGHAANGGNGANGNGTHGNGANGGQAASPDEEPAAAPPAARPAKKSVGGAIVEGLKGAASPLLRFFDLLGNHLLLALRALSWLPRRPFRIANYLEAGEYIGFGSLPIVLLVGSFTGMVMSLQSVFAFRQFGLESFAGGTTGKALSTELGPVLTSLMLAGRAGAGIATELGTMRITEQIDALESMAVNPTQYLVLPRVIAAMIVTPILTLLFFLFGMGGAWLVAVVFQNVDQGQWVANLRDITTPTDVIQGLIKGLFFGFMVALVGCFQGYNATGGGRGVGMGTTRAVVIGSVSTLIADYFLSDILLSLFHTAKG
ncbi:MAG TPA: ABC transporter permease [Kofleriaceae bacterium]|nr:ABC transporter permease [Kofleriaceae bacterium]